MTTPRTVKFFTKFNLLRRKPFHLFFGTFFSFSPLLILAGIFLVFSSIEDDTPNVDYELINQKGKEITAEVTNIETQYNVTINSVHPTIISYKYKDNGREIQSKYMVLEERRIEQLDIGDDLVVIDLNGKSIVKGIEPFELFTPFFLLLPIPFLIIGLPFLVYAIYDYRKELKLYRHGRLSKGKIISMMPKSRLLFFRFGQGIIVHYEFETRSGNAIIGESLTTDFSIISDKKKGDLVPIFVSNENESKSCIVPKRESLRNGWRINFE